MRWSWRRPALLIVAGAVIAAASSVLTMQYLQCPHYGRHLLRMILRTQYHPNPNTAFHLYMSTTEAGPNGVTVDGYTYRASDCVTVFSGFYKFNSIAEATGDIRKKVTTAYHVYETTTGAGEGGDAANERVVLKFEAKGNYFIFVRGGSRVREISSESLPHAQLFEQRYHIDMFASEQSVVTDQPRRGNACSSM